MKCKILCPQINSYWNIATLIHLPIVYGSFSPTRAELRVVTETASPTKPTIVTIWPFTEKAGQPLIQSHVAIKSIYQPKFKESVCMFK